MHSLTAAPDRPCRHCRWFDGPDGSGSHARCVRGGSLMIEAIPARGCVHHEREPGSDDEPGPPPGLTVTAPISTYR